MESRFNIHIRIYDDLPELRRAINSIPRDVVIHVLDGRYADFDGGTLLTPGASDLCRERPNLRYHAPSEDRLPFGDLSVGKSYRDSIYKKACWAYYEVLPEDQWTIRMDSDERLIYLDRTFFERISDDKVFSPRIYMREDLSDSGNSSVISCTMRIFKPKYWTFWTGDLMIPRHQCERGLGAKETKKIHQDVDQREFREKTQSVIIENLGEKRPDDYLSRRMNQLTGFH